MVHAHDGGAAGEVREFLTPHVLAHGVDIRGSRLGHGVHPHVEADVMRLHRIVRHPAVVADILVPGGDEFRVLRRVGGHEVVPRREMADEVGGVEARQLLLADGEGDDRDVVGGHAGGREFLVEADVGVAVDGRDHADLLAVGSEGDDVGHDLGPVRVAEGRVVHEDVALGHALRFQIALEDVVRGPRIDVVGAQKREFLDAQLVKEVVGGGDRLLVRRRSGVEDVFRAFLALVLDRIEQQAVEFLDHRQDRLAADAGPVAEDHVDVVHGEKLARLLREERPVRGGIHDDGLEFASQQAALGVLLFHEHQHGVLERGLRDRHGAGKRMQHAHLDRAVLSQRRRREADDRGSGRERVFQQVHQFLLAGGGCRTLAGPREFPYLQPAASCCTRVAAGPSSNPSGRHTPDPEAHAPRRPVNRCCNAPSKTIIPERPRSRCHGIAQSFSVNRAFGLLFRRSRGL